MNIKVHGLRVVIKPDKAEEEKTESGIIISQAHKKAPPTGTIVGVGWSTEEEDMTSKVGDRVVYGRVASTVTADDGEEYLIVNETDIIADIIE